MDTQLFTVLIGNMDTKRNNMTQVFIGGDSYHAIKRDPMMYYIRSNRYMDTYNELNTNDELAHASDFIFEIVKTNNGAVHEQLLRKSPNKL